MQHNAHFVATEQNQQLAIRCFLGKWDKNRQCENSSGARAKTWRDVLMGWGAMSARWANSNPYNSQAYTIACTALYIIKKLNRLKKMI